MAHKISFKLACLLFILFTSQHLFCSFAEPAEYAVITKKDRFGRATYQLGQEGRATHVDLNNGEMASRLKIAIDVLSEEDKDEATKNYEPPLQKAKILVPFMAGVAIPVITMWYRSAFSLQEEVLRTTLVTFAAYECADIRSFWLHMVADHTDVNNKDYPIAFKYIPVFFQDHHLRGNEINKASYWYISRVFYVIDLFTLLPLATAMTVGGYEVSASVLALSALLFEQNQIIHAYAHGKKFKNRFLHSMMHFFQSTGCIISKKFHAAHHSDPKHSVKYSAISGHSELFCERFFPRLIPYIETRCQGILEGTAACVKSAALILFSETSSFIRYVWG